jgi:sirohydrochlorin cobaltochelatase
VFSEQTGLLIVGHGTRSAQGQAEFLETAELLARMAPRTPVAACYLELAEPSIAQGIEQLVARGVRQVVVLPLLLFAAGHAKEDIPVAVHACQGNYPGVEFTFASHLGCHERLLQLSAQRFEEAMQTSADEVAAQDTLWLMVGRGSRDPSATAEMREFVQRRLRHTPVGQVRVAYVAMAEPRFEKMLVEVAELRFRRVVVQPHLLFHGELLDAVSQKVEETSARWPHQQWLVAPHLGAADLLAEAILERFCERALLTGV